MGIDVYSQLTKLCIKIREFFPPGCVPESVERELRATEEIVRDKDVGQAAMKHMDRVLMKTLNHLETAEKLALATCRWVRKDRVNALNEFVYAGRVLSMNTDHTLKALDRVDPSATGWYLVDVVSLFLKENYIYIDMNVIHPYGQPDDAEYWHLEHISLRRKGYKYVVKSGDWTGIDFDKEQYWELRDETREQKEDT